MTPTRWQEIERVYHAALERPPTRRDEFLTEACKNDSELRREVESLLAHDSSKTGKLDQPAWVGVDGLRALDATVTVMIPGTRLGPYRIEGPLGKGGMGEVFRAVDTRLGRSVAVKVCDKQFGGRFEREARAISTLNHPHICTLYDVGPNYLVMELVEGETLASRLNRKSLPMDLVLRYGEQIGEALAVAHAKGIIHRDLKPQNIMITKSGVKVLDFGLAKSPDDETLTAPRVVMGTPAYMAPEQREGKECDARADIYSLGLVLYEMATGKRPDHESVKALEALPEALAHVIEGCLNAEPDERWQSARDVQKELAWAGQLRPHISQPNQRRRSILVYAVGIALLAGVILSVTWTAYVNQNDRVGGGQSLPLNASLQTIAGYTGTERSGAISPDGKFFAFVSDRGGTPDIWVRQISGGEPIQITHDAVGEQDLIYAQDGESIYYATVEVPSTIQRVGVLGGTPRRVVRGGRWPAPSPDGKRLAFGAISTNMTYGDALLVAEADGSQPRAILEARDIKVQSLSWSPDGRWIAFVSNKGLFSPYAINVINPEGRDQQVISTFASGVSFATTWTPDSRNVIYSYDAGPLANRADIWMKPIDGGMEQRLTLNPRGSFLSLKASQDGKRLVGTVQDADYEVWKVPLESDPIVAAGGAVRILESSWQPMWIQVAATGTLLFNSPATGERNLWSAALDGSAMPRQITFVPGGTITHASMSADGTQVAFVAVTSGNGQIWAVTADGSGLRQLTMDASAKSWPFWSPDKKWIMFASQSPATPQLWKVSSSGGKAEQFTQEGGLRGDWSPTGDRIAYDVGDNRFRIARAFDGKVLIEIKAVVDLTSPVWSPDGKLISAHGPSSVWIVDPNTGRSRLAVKFPDGYRFNFRAAWTPDGKSVVVNRQVTTSRIVLLQDFYREKQ